MINRVKRLVARLDRSMPGARVINGVRYTLDPRSRRGFSWIRNNDYEADEWVIIGRYCRPGHVVLDVGANIGILTIRFSRAVGPEGRVWAFEPNGVVFSQLLENLRRNGGSNVVPVQTLVSSQPGVSEFFVAPWGDFNPMSAMVSHDGRAQRVTLPMLSLDSLLPNFERVDYIKIDVEGAELRVLRGATELLRRYRPVVQVEVHGMYLPSFGDSIDELFELLTELGYSLINVVDGQPTDAADFKRDTKLHVPHPLDGSDLAHQGYGHLLAVHNGV